MVVGLGSGRVVLAVVVTSVVTGLTAVYAGLHQDTHRICTRTTVLMHIAEVVTMGMQRRLMNRRAGTARLAGR